MAEIIGVDGTELRVGTDDGAVIAVPIGLIRFANPTIGQHVNVYRDGNNYVVTPAMPAAAAVTASGTKTDFGTVVAPGTSPKSRGLASILGFFLGVLGVHRFYLGNIALGVCMLLFGWLTLFIWPFVDWLVVLCGGAKDGQRLPVKNW
ncbi:TM2 domain-containing protein [Nocardioides sp. Iso805N]|uniref:TM2 domain-containing protein n=1 Tax=Nocardioides sp. Iso805N TaxID=1283287 RepID=UPI0003711D17|nr:TM2 domain-containing protein [Nocardioides sp. Iso805N]